MPLSWVAHYSDNTVLAQADGASYSQINRHKLVAFDLVSEGHLLVRVDLRPNDVSEGVEARRLIWRIRHLANTNGNGSQIHLIGWQRRVNGRNVQAINYVFEDGVVLLGGQFTNQDFMDEIVPLECEMDLIK